MDKRIVILGIVILLVLVLVLFGVYIRMKYTSQEGVRVIVYHQGKEIKLNPEITDFKELQKKGESLFVNANDALDLIVTGRTIEKAKEETTSVEILYSKPKEFTFQLGKPYTQKVDALLISLDNKSAVIYYSVNGSYSSGPYVNTKEEVKKVRDLLQDIEDFN